MDQPRLRLEDVAAVLHVPGIAQLNRCVVWTARHAGRIKFDDRCGLDGQRALAHITRLRDSIVLDNRLNVVTTRREIRSTPVICMDDTGRGRLVRSDGATKTVIADRLRCVTIQIHGISRLRPGHNIRDREHW